jgi:hypothetical protein
MISFLRRLFHRGPIGPAVPSIPCFHEMAPTQAWYDALLAMDQTLPRVRVNLGQPEFSHQGNAGRCTGESLEGQAGVMARQFDKSFFPEIDAREIYQAAKPRDRQHDHQAGSDLWAAAEAYCVLAGTGIGWARLKLHPHVLRGVLRVPDGEAKGRPIAFGAAFHPTDFYTGVSGRVMLPGHGSAGNHAMLLHGYDPKVSYRVSPVSDRQAESECFLLRNTNTPHDREPWLYPIWRAQGKAGAVEAIILTLPDEEGFVPRT